MSEPRLPKTLFLVILAAALAQCIHDYPLLPDRLASHFSASGMPNGWMTKTQFFVTYGIVLLPALYIEFRLPRRIAKTPAARLNLPNKEYWLAPERRAETFAYFEKFFAWFGCALLLLEVFAMGLAIRANLETPPHMPTGPILAAIISFVAYSIIAVIVVYRRFAKPE
jgi:uncharacterized membrane protein